MLDEDRVEDHFIWSIAGRNAKTFFWMMENLDILQATELYALQRTDKYIDLEPDEDD
jgi:hypothetical protein